MQNVMRSGGAFIFPAIMSKLFVDDMKSKS